MSTRRLIVLAALMVAAATVVACGSTTLTATPTSHRISESRAAATASDGLADFRSVVHGYVTKITTDEHWEETCGGGLTISNPTDCHQAIAVLKRDSQNMLTAVHGAVVPLAGTTIKEQLSTALRDLLRGCDDDESTLAAASSSVFDLPGSTTTAAFDDLLAANDDLQYAWT